MAHALVLEAQRREGTLVAEDQGVVERAAARQPAAAQGLDLAQEAEGAGRRDLAREDLGRQAEAGRLLAQGRVVEADAVAQPQLGGRRDAHPLVVPAHLDRADDLEEAARHRQGPQAGLEHEVDEGRGAAVQDRHLGPVELDAGVVHPQRIECRQQVLDGLDAGLAGGEPRGVVETREALDPGRDLASQIAADETQAAARLCRRQVQPHVAARVEPHALDVHGAFQGESGGHTGSLPLSESKPRAERSVTVDQQLMAIAHGLLTTAVAAQPLLSEVLWPQHHARQKPAPPAASWSRQTPPSRISRIWSRQWRSSSSLV